MPRRSARRRWSADRDGLSILSDATQRNHRDFVELQAAILFAERPAKVACRWVSVKYLPNVVPATAPRVVNFCNPLITMARLRSLQVSGVRRFSTTSALAAARRRGDSQLQAAALNASRPTTTSQSILFGTPLLRTDLMPQLGDAANTELSRVVRQTFFRASSQISAETQAAYRHEAALREGDENNPLGSAETMSSSSTRSSGSPSFLRPQKAASISSCPALPRLPPSRPSRASSAAAPPTI